MTVQELADALGCTIRCGEGDSLSREICGGYCGDLLSWVMGRAKADDVWMTIMGNMNAVAVATLVDVACILLCEGVKLDEEGTAKALQQEVAVLETDSPAYEIAVQVAELLK